MAIVERLQELSRCTRRRRELAGLDALDAPADDRRSLARAASGARRGRSCWPSPSSSASGSSSCGAAGGPSTSCPSPPTVFKRFFQDLGDGTTGRPSATRMKRAAIGYALALRHRHRSSASPSPASGRCGPPSARSSPGSRPCRRSPGSRSPSCCSSCTEGSIMFVVVIGAAPAIANGVISGVDHIPPLLAAGRAGARRQEPVAVPPRGPAGARGRRTSAV